ESTWTCAAARPPVKTTARTAATTTSRLLMRLSPLLPVSGLIFTQRVSHWCKRRVTNLLRHRVPESVADPAHGLDPRLGELRAGELRAEPGHMDVHRAWLHEALASPDDVEQLLARKDSARSAHQRRQELEFLGG